MFTERELLMLSYCLDRTAREISENELWFRQHEADQLGHKIHRVLQATRKLTQEESR